MRKAWLIVIFIVLIASGTSGQTFERVATDPERGEMDYIFAVADFNNDGRDDIVAGDMVEPRGDFMPEDRLTKVPLHVFLGEEDGTFRHAADLVGGPIEAHAAVVVAADFNNDGQPDLAVFDHGAYVDTFDHGIGSFGLGFGNPPQLFLSDLNSVLQPSDALAEAVRVEHERRDPPFNAPLASGPSDLHLKAATAGDIDGDGDLDMWVESAGGANVTNHFMVNNDQGVSWSVDINRASSDVLRNQSLSDRPWRYHEGALLDVDHDDDPDLVAGQLRDTDRDDQFSVLLFNDGTGHYPTRFELPHPSFNEGYTRVFGIVDFDLNEDSAGDMLMLHVRNDVDGGWSGRYIQALLSTDGGTAFVDETSTWVSDQSATTPWINQDGDQLYNLGQLRMHDVDLDGCEDLVVFAGRAHIRVESPLVYRNNGSGQFQAMSPEPFAGDDDYFGRHAVSADVNGDAVIDFVVPHHNEGPDEEWGTDDDFTTFITLVNTTSPQPVRCE